MSIKYSKIFNRKKTRQTEPMNEHQVLNSAGGYSFAVDCWTRLDRFLILGTEGGSYYARQRELTIDSAKSVQACIAANGVRTVKRIVEISDSGRAAKNDPAIFALAMCAKTGDDLTRKAAREALSKVCRIGTHLFHFVRDVEAFGGWGRGTRRAVAKWYTDMPADRLAYQAVKYQSRDGWSHRDVLRLSHPKTIDTSKNDIFKWIVSGQASNGDVAPDDATRIVWAHERAKKVDTKADLISLIVDHKLPRESVPTQWLTDADVWAALLPSMPLTALIRNLATMTRVGLLAPMSTATKQVVSMLGNRQVVLRARVHPIAILSALMTYQAGRGVRGKGTWTPVTKIVDALDASFYASFANVKPTNKRWLLALDVSGSMGCGMIGGVPGLTPRVASAAMALITAAVEPDHAFIAFTSGGWAASTKTRYDWNNAVQPIDISPRQRLDAVLKQIDKLGFGGTDCALPMLYAKAKKIDVDAFVVLTDSETWAGDIHPAQALVDYRNTRGIGAKLITVGMVSNGFSIADPNDAGMLDVVGFDTQAPALMSDFVR